MRIVQLTPGTGNFHCGSCLRDTAMVRQLRRMGHDVLMVPLYLPHVTDGQDLSDAPVFFGGINVYLQHKSAFFRHTPAWFDRLLDRPRLLRWAANHSEMTSAADLGELTVSMLEGEQGHQNKELTKLIEFLQSDGRPDVVLLSNGLLVGLARRLKRELGAKVLCTLAGEAPFLDSLHEPYAGQAWRTMSERAADVDLFLPVSHYYARLMSERMGLDPSRYRVIHIGVDPLAFNPAVKPTEPTIGYMAYMYEGEGLSVLVDAFIELARRNRVPKARLRVAGAMMSGDKPYVQSLCDKLDAAGLSGRYDFLPNITGGQKRMFLSKLSVLSVPAIYGESFGLYLLEAWASGVPVAQPKSGAFVELLEHTGAGLLCEPNDPVSLADALERMLRDEDETRRMGDRGRRMVHEHYNINRMAEQVLQACEGRLPSLQTSH